MALSRRQWFNEEQPANQTLASTSDSVAPATKPAAAAATEANGVLTPPAKRSLKFGPLTPEPPPPPPVVEPPPPTPEPAAKPHKAPVRVRKVEVSAPVVKAPPPPAAKAPAPAPARRVAPPPPPPVVVAAAAAEPELETVLSELQQVHDAQLEPRPLALNGKPLAALLRNKVDAALRQDYLFHEMLLLVADGADDMDIDAHVKSYHRRSVPVGSSPQLHAVLADLVARDLGEFMAVAAVPARLRQSGVVHLSDYMLAHRQLLFDAAPPLGTAMTPAAQVQGQALDELEAVWVKSARADDPKRKRSPEEAAAEKLATKRKRDAVLREVGHVYSGALVRDLIGGDMRMSKVWALAGVDDATSTQLAEAGYNLKVTNDIRYRALTLRALKGGNRVAERKRKAKKAAAAKK